MSTEAMKLALEALEGSTDKTLSIRAITALREALAEQQQEPVAWRWKRGDSCWQLEDVQPRSPTAQPLYTAPPAQRKPLTDEEVETVWRSVQANDFHDCVKPFARAIEAKHNIKGDA